MIGEARTPADRSGARGRGAAPVGEAERDFMLRAWANGRSLLVLTGPKGTPARTASDLLAAGVDPALRAWVGARLGLEGEEIGVGSLNALRARSFHWLSVTVIGHPAEGGLRLVRPL